MSDDLIDADDAYAAVRDVEVAGLERRKWIYQTAEPVSDGVDQGQVLVHPGGAISCRSAALDS